MKELYIARHGQDEDNAEGRLNGRRNRPLTELGISQANTLAENIKESGLNFNVILSSPLSRAFDTAKIIAKHLEIADPIVIESLVERDLGILAGKVIKEIPTEDQKMLITDTVNYFLEPDGAETFTQLLERGSKVLDEIKKYDTPLVVAHGDIGKMIYASYY